MNLSTEQIIKLCQAGQQEHFTELYDAHVKKIYNFLYYRTLHKQTAEDLTSDVFFKALGKIKSFDPKKASFNTWLHQIARNTLIDHYRSSKPAEDIEAAWDISTGENIETDADNKMRLEAVKKSLSILTPQARQIVTLRLWDDMSHKEIAELMGITEANSKMAFSRALSKLQTQIGTAGLIALLLIPPLS
jgi:RNA polymerase sigma-70 factor (ECF subfamily)